MGLEDVLKELEFLKTWIGNIDSNVKFNITMQWAALAFVITAAGTALYYLAKVWFEKFADKKLEKLKREIINEVANYRIIRTSRCIGLSGIQIVSYSDKARGLIIKAYFEDERRSYNCKFIKDMLMYTENGASRDSIKIICPNGATSEVKVKSSVENGVQLEWTTDGDVEMVNANLDIMIF